MKRGSRVPRIQRMILEIKNLERSYDIAIHCVWLRRSNKLIEIADQGSKNKNTDEWSFADSDYNQLVNRFNVKPTIDMMASEKYTKCETYFSKLPDPNTAGVDIFCQTLSEGNIYFCNPPVDLACRIIDKIKKSPGITVILVVPRWPSCVFWGMLKDITGFIPIIKQFFFFHTHFYAASEKCLFRGKKDFQLAAFLIQT